MENILNLNYIIFTPLILGVLTLAGIFKNNTIVIRRVAKWFLLAHFLYTVLFLINFDTHLQINYLSKLPSYILNGSQVGLSYFATIGICAVSFVALISSVFSKYLIQKKQRLFYSFLLMSLGAFMAILCAQGFYLILISLAFEIICAYMLYSNFSKSSISKGSNLFIFLNCLSYFILIMSISLLNYSFTKSGLVLNVSNLLNYNNELDEIVRNIAFFGFLFFTSLKIPFFLIHKAQFEVIEKSNPALSIIIFGEFFIGAYFFINFIFYAFNPTFTLLAPKFSILLLASAIYFILLATKEVDLRKSFAYYFISQANLALLPICSSTQLGVNSFVINIISILTINLCLFFCYSEAVLIFKTTKLKFMGNILSKSQSLTIFAFLSTILACAVPISYNFFAKGSIILSCFSNKNFNELANWAFAIFATVALLLSAYYLMRNFHHMFLKSNFEEQKRTIGLSKSKIITYGLMTTTIVVLTLCINQISTQITKYSNMIMTSFN